MIDSGEMPAAHAKLYRTLFHQTLRNEHIRLPDLTVYLRTEPDVLERRRAKRAAEGDDYAETITQEYLREIHDSYEAVAANWRRTLLRYQEHAIVPPDADLHHAARRDRHDRASGLRARRGGHHPREGPAHDRVTPARRVSCRRQARCLTDELGSEPARDPDLDRLRSARRGCGLGLVTAAGVRRRRSGDERQRRAREQTNTVEAGPHSSLRRGRSRPGGAGGQAGGRRADALAGIHGRPGGHHALHRLPQVRGGLQPPQPPAAHGRALLRPGRPPHVPAADRDAPSPS